MWFKSPLKNLLLSLWVSKPYHGVILRVRLSCQSSVVMESDWGPGMCLYIADSYQSLPLRADWDVDSPLCPMSLPLGQDLFCLPLWRDSKPCLVMLSVRACFAPLGEAQSRVRCYPWVTLPSAALLVETSLTGLRPYKTKHCSHTAFSAVWQPMSLCSPLELAIRPSSGGVTLKT